MSKIRLYKDENLVFEKEGIKKNDMYVFDNIIYNVNDKVLIREDDSFKYTLNFSLNEAIVELKENNFFLNLNLTTTNMIIESDYHEIIYTIESEELIKNKIEITF